MSLRRIREVFSEMFRRRQTPPSPPPWYTGPPTFPAARSLVPPPQQVSTVPPDWAKITQVARQPDSLLHDTQQVLSNTQPGQDEEDTRQSRAVHAPVRGPYDDLFPPPQPGDEDYLETDTSIAPVPEDQPPDDQVPDEVPPDDLSS